MNEHSLLKKMCVFMVDKNLVKELKQKMDAGVESAKPEDTLKIFEFVKQIALECDDLKEETEGKDITMQVEITDTGAKYWVRGVNGKVEYGEGIAPVPPNFTWIAPFKIATEVVFGKTSAQSAFMNGSVQIKGKIRDAMEFQNVIDIAMDEFKTLAEDL